MEWGQYRADACELSLSKPRYRPSARETPPPRAMPMPRPKKRTQITLSVLMLWVLVASVYCWNLRIVAVDQRENVELIWKEWTR